MATISRRQWTYKGAIREAWVCRYADATGTWRLRTFKKQKDAAAWLRNAENEIADGRHTPDRASITVAQAGELWHKHGETAKLEMSTLRMYRQHLRYHINPAIGATKLSRLTAPMVKKFMADMLAKNSPALTRKVMTSLRMLLTYAQGEGAIAQNVALAVRFRRSKRGEAKIVPPTKEEVQRLLAAAPGRWRPLLAVAAFSGVRASEARGLPWPNLDLEVGALHVKQRADAWGVIGPVKSEAGERTIPIPPIVCNLLRAWREKCPKGELDLVFPNGAGRVETLPNIHHRFWGPLQLAVGITRAKGKDVRPKYGWHALRHFYVSWLIDQGFSPKRVQELAGHASITTTMDRYGHLWPNRDDDQQRLELAAAAIVGTHDKTETRSSRAKRNQKLAAVS